MVFSWFSACLLATAVAYVTSEFNEGLCTLLRESNGLIPPPLPRNFESWSEHIDYNEKDISYTEVYFDYTNTRGKYMHLEKGIEYHNLYDYETHQIVSWGVLHPGMDIKEDTMSHECYVEDMKEEPDPYTFGFIDEFSQRPKMYNAYEMMRYGGQYQYAFNGTDRLTNRGLLVDKFTGCVYDQEIDTTMLINIAFSNGSVLTSSGTTRFEVLGVEDGILSVPIKSDYIGTVYDEFHEQLHNFNKTENFFWFKGEPEFKREAFKIPPYLYCPNYRGRKEMIPMPTEFSTRVQRTDLARDIMGKMVITEVTSFEEVYYFKEKGLARRDFTPNPNIDTDIKSKFQSLAPVRTVYDFNEGLVYITHKPTGRCYTRPIMFGDFFESSNDTMFILMANPEEIFFMQRDEMEYKGTDFVRDIECDVFTGKYFDKRFNASFVKETYISTNGWHEESDEVLEYGVPVQHTILNKEVSDEPVEVVSTYSFLKFKAAPPHLMNFDVSNCIETIDHKNFVLFLAVSNEVKEALFMYRTRFVETAQYYISSISQLATPLRVQRVKLSELSLSDKRTVLHFTMVGKANLKTSLPVGQAGASLAEAVAILQAFIDKNLFNMPFYKPDATDSIIISARKGSLYIKTANGQLQGPVSTEKQQPVEHVYNIQRATEKPVEKKKGMSSGALAGLALGMLIIGLGIGIGIMYLYLKRFSENKLEDRITLTPQVSYTSQSGGVVDTSLP